MFTISADQWIETGFVFRSGYVAEYEIDRKEQTYMEFERQSLVTFFSRKDLSPAQLAWAIELSQAKP